MKNNGFEYGDLFESCNAAQSARFEFITPETAERYLLKNVNNFRTHNKNDVANLAQILKDGDFEAHGQTISFDQNGGLRDGQHRLMAIVLSGIAAPIWVIRGVSPEGGLSVDRGRKRSVAQYLKSMGVANPKDMASVALRYLSHDLGAWHISTFSSIPSLGNAQNIVKCAIDNHDCLQSAIRLARKQSKSVGAVMSAVASVYAIAARGGIPEDMRDIVWFADRLADGVGLSSGEPVLALRNRVMKEKAGGTFANFNFDRWIVTIAWNRTVEGRPMKMLKFKLAGENKSQAPTEVLPSDCVQEGEEV